MTFTDTAYPSSAAFDVISASLQDDAARKKALKQGGAIFAIEIKNPAKETSTWYIDLKESGTIGKGAAPEGKKADVTIVLADADFASLVSGKANAQKLFMAGKLKIRGDMTKATRLSPVFESARAKAKL